MGIFYKPLAGAVRAFDTDVIKSITPKLSEKPRAENLPCHLVITQADNPNVSETVAGARLPVIIYGKVYTDQSVIIDVDDTLIVDKLDDKGEVIASYYGVAGIPTVKQSRKEAMLKITSVKQPEPIPETMDVQIFTPDMEGGYTWLGGFTCSLTTRTEQEQSSEGGFVEKEVNYIIFVDGWTFKENGVFYTWEQVGYEYQVKQYARIKSVSTIDRFNLISDPVLKDGKWMAKYE